MFRRRWEGRILQSRRGRRLEGGVADDVVPVIDGKLAGNEGSTLPVSVLEHLKEVSALGLGEGLEPEVVDLCGASHK